MVNSFNSWYDSDDIDSDLEQEAYSLLYSDNFNEFKVPNKISNLQEKVENTVGLSLNSLSNSENDCSKSLSDNEDLVINLLSSSDSTTNFRNTSDSDSDSDSDSIEYIPILKCSNVDNDICIGSSSEESDYEAVHKSMNSNTSTLMMNIVSDEQSQQNNSLGDKSDNFNKVDNLFFNVKSKDSNWSIDFKPLLKNKFSSRYYENSSKSVCSICTKKGHSEKQCTRSGPVCILCGNEGHLNKKCESLVCFSCFHFDHRTKSCPSVKKFLSLGCKRCGQRGHSDQICPDVWRQYKYTVTPGPPVFNKCSSQNKSTVFCANCAKSGHFTEQCPRNRMNSHFIGPPPIMEIIKFDDFDIYEKAGINYSDKFVVKNNKSKIHVEFPSFIENMNVTTILEDVDVAHESDINEVSSSVKEPGNSNFGDGFIMLSPIVMDTKDTKKSQAKRFIDMSTPRTINFNKLQIDKTELKPKTPTKLPGITTELLKKLFPEETRNMDKLPPYLRKKLRKKLKNFIEHGYLPGDSNMTQERMEFWLQEISTGRSLNYREKKKLLGSVSAALHSISDRVSSREIMDCSEINFVSAECSMGDIKENSLSIQEQRKHRNKSSRTEKNLKNSLKISRKEKKMAQAEDTIKSRLRKTSVTTEEPKPKPKKSKFKRRKRNFVHKEMIKLI